MTTELEFEIEGPAAGEAWFDPSGEPTQFLEDVSASIARIATTLEIEMPRVGHNKNDDGEVVKWEEPTSQQLVIMLIHDFGEGVRLVSARGPEQVVKDALVALQVNPPFAPATGA